MRHVTVVVVHMDVHFLVCGVTFYVDAFTHFISKKKGIPSPTKAFSHLTTPR